MNYDLVSDYAPTGDQPHAIEQLTEGIDRGDKAQVLLGVTGSGKTFTIANVIKNVNKPTRGGNSDTLASTAADITPGAGHQMLFN